MAINFPLVALNMAKGDRRSEAAVEINDMSTLELIKHGLSKFHPLIDETLSTHAVL